MFLEFKPTSVERTLGSLGSTEDSKLRHVIFIVIESGMVLFAIQLVRVVLTSLMMQTVFTDITGPLVGMELVIGIHEMFNVIIKSFLFYIFSFTDDRMICICLARASHQQLFCGPQWSCPSMTKSPLRKLLEVFVLIIPQVIRIHSGEYEVVHRPRRGVKVLISSW